MAWHLFDDLDALEDALCRQLDHYTPLVVQSVTSSPPCGRRLTRLAPGPTLLNLRNAQIDLVLKETNALATNKISATRNLQVSESEME
jgi:hypothetical protein